MPAKRARKLPDMPKANSTRAAGFVLAAVCYCFLVFLPSQTPARVSWWLLAIVIIPVLTGALAAKGTNKMDTPGQRFANGFWMCGRAMFLYTAVILMVTHSKVGGNGNALTVLFISALVACVYTSLAGIMAGLAGIVFYLQSDRRGGQA